MKHRNLFLTAALAAAFGVSSNALAGGDSAHSGTSAGSAEKSAMTDKYSGSGAKSASAQGSQSRAEQGVEGAAALLVFMPVTVASTDTLGNGCWARLYDDQNFSGDRLSLVGPIEMPNMRTPFGGDWSGEFDSVAIGPKARVTVYDNENYSQRVATFEPGQKIENLGGTMGFFEQVRSLKIACVDQGAARTAAGEQDRSADQVGAVSQTGSKEQESSAGRAAASDQAKSGAQVRPQPLIADPASPQGLRSFSSLDKDGDGSISRAEWNASSEQTAAAAN